MNFWIVRKPTKESNWAGLKSMVDSDEITVNGMAQFVLFCLSKSLLNQLLFVENVINLQTEKKPLDQAKVSSIKFDKLYNPDKINPFSGYTVHTYVPPGFLQKLQISFSRISPQRTTNRVMRTK